MSNSVRYVILGLAVMVACPAGAEPVTIPAEAGRCLIEGALADVDRADALLSRIEHVPPEHIPQQAERVAELQVEYGPLDERLFADTFSLGLAYREAGDFHNAAITLRSALQIERANAGLQAESQLPVLDYVIDAHINLGNWGTVSDLHGLRLWIYRRNYGPDDPRLLPALRDAFRWHVGAYNKDTGYTLDTHYVEARAAEVDLLRIAEQCTGDPQLARCYLEDTCCAGEACAGSVATTP